MEEEPVGRLLHNCATTTYAVGAAIQRSPVALAVSFVFFHIPALDAYLAKRYGREFDDYAARTGKFVPFLY